MSEGTGRPFGRREVKGALNDLKARKKAAVRRLKREKLEAFGPEAPRHGRLTAAELAPLRVSLGDLMQEVRG